MTAFRNWRVSLRSGSMSKIIPESDIFASECHYKSHSPHWKVTGIFTESIPVYPIQFPLTHLSSGVLRLRSGVKKQLIMIRPPNSRGSPLRQFLQVMFSFFISIPILTEFLIFQSDRQKRSNQGLPFWRTVQFLVPG